MSEEAAKKLKVNIVFKSGKVYSIEMRRDEFDYACLEKNISSRLVYSCGEIKFLILYMNEVALMEVLE